MAASSNPTDTAPSSPGEGTGPDADGRHESPTGFPTGQPKDHKRQPARSTGSLTPVTPRGEATRRRILDAAEVVFGEQGYYGASVAEITRRAGVAQGTFYIYFHSKREIFIELVEDLGKSFRQATRAGMEGSTDRLEAERHGFAAFF